MPQFKTILFVTFILFFFYGCEKKIKIEEKEIFNINELFNTTNQIKSTNEKKLLLIFGKEEDKFNKMLFEDIKTSLQIQRLLKESFTIYYILVDKDLQYKIYYKNKQITLNTKALLNLYNISSIPSLIFTNNKAEEVFKIPGYMKKEQLFLTLEFFKTNTFEENENKKKIFYMLKEYYLKNGIELN
ncbi:thioredoxin fold domain-containing protein [Malaciobacter mytili]|uniref:thioredoxin fold domain-containing protein n=1 Tax=Malaciobacter mytili TaxID=603050 RepID=UPI003BAF387A